MTGQQQLRALRGWEQIRPWYDVAGSPDSEHRAGTGYVQNQRQGGKLAEAGR